jgi:hypothetical protein
MLHQAVSDGEFSPGTTPKTLDDLDYPPIPAGCDWSKGQLRHRLQLASKPDPRDDARYFLRS